MGIGRKSKDNINMADFEEYVALYVYILCTLILRRRLRRLRVRPRRMWSRAWLQRRRTRSCYNTLLQELRAEDIDEYKNMRMSKETFNMLLEKVQPYIMRSFTNSFVQLNFWHFIWTCLSAVSRHIYHVLLFAKYLNDLDSKNHSDWLVPIKVHQSV